MATALALILAALEAIPPLKDLFDRLVAEYTKRALAGMREDYRNGIKKAVEEYDQRDLEKSIGSPKAGIPSGLPGAVIVDRVRGVPDKTGSGSDPLVK